MHLSETKMNGDTSLADMRKRREELDARIERREAQLKVKARKQRTQYLIVFAATILADLEHHPEIGAGLEESLKRGATGDRERKLLRAFGWRL
jgi:regulation of enolase protein 1 (concanavalin A-like superfamily)